MKEAFNESNAKQINTKSAKITTDSIADINNFISIQSLTAQVFLYKH